MPTEQATIDLVSVPSDVDTALALVDSFPLMPKMARTHLPEARTAGSQFTHV